MRRHGLTPRETDVARQALLRLPNEQIARKLALTRGSVRNQGSA